MPHRRGYSRKTRSESSQSSADKRSYPQIIREIHGLTGHMGVRSIIPADAVGAFQALACEPNLPPEIGPRNLGQLAASRLMIVLDTAMKIHNRRPASDFSDIWGPAVNELDKKIKLSPGKVSAVMNALAVARTLYLASPPPGNPAECFGPFLGALDKWITIQDKLGASAGESSETKAPNAKRHKNKGRKSKGSQPKEAQPNEGHETQGHTTKRKLAQHDEATEEERAKRRRLSPIHFTVQETPSKKHLNKQEEASGPDTTSPSPSVYHTPASKRTVAPGDDLEAENQRLRDRLQEESDLVKKMRSDRDILWGELRQHINPIRRAQGRLEYEGYELEVYLQSCQHFTYASGRPENKA